MCAKPLQLCPTLCNPIDCSFSGSSVHGILQARILECVATPRDLPDPGIEPVSLTSPALADRFFTTNAIWKAHSGTLYMFCCLRDSAHTFIKYLSRDMTGIIFLKDFLLKF